MVVCDRENHRLEYFRIDPSDPSVFAYTRTVSFDPLLRRPCNLRTKQQHSDDNEGNSLASAIVPFLEGSVGILDHGNNLVDVVNITATLGHLGFLHPHDAHFVPGTKGDFVVATWNPGRIGYFRRVEAAVTTTATTEKKKGVINKQLPLPTNGNSNRTLLPEGEYVMVA
mmetsp:Transcript_26034/g.57348  ORF Transcript_26034/g.57348 Transcript_26034/m.57348 type:complete len:169 (+) Transcript_26034:2-508(+)